LVFQELVHSVQSVNADVGKPRKTTNGQSTRVLSKKRAEILSLPRRRIRLRSDFRPSQAVEESSRWCLALVMVECDLDRAIAEQSAQPSRKPRSIWSKRHFKRLAVGRVFHGSEGEGPTGAVGPRKVSVFISHIGGGTQSGRLTIKAGRSSYASTTILHGMFCKYRVLSRKNPALFQKPLNFRVSCNSVHHFFDRPLILY